MATDYVFKLSKRSSRSGIMGAATTVPHCSRDFVLEIQ